jgi:hypothetical protein
MRRQQKMRGPLPTYSPLYTAIIRARICKRLGSPGINSMESIPLAYVDWRAGVLQVGLSYRPPGRFLGSLKGLQIRALGKWTSLFYFQTSDLQMYILRTLVM